MANYLKVSRSFHTRSAVTLEQEKALDAAANVYGQVLRQVHKSIRNGEDDPRTRLTAELGIQRWYIDSAMRRVKGLLKSAKANRERVTDEMLQRAAAADRKSKKQLDRARRARTPRKRQEYKQSAYYAKCRANKLRDKAAAKKIEKSQSVSALELYLKNNLELRFSGLKPTCGGLQTGNEKLL